MLKKIVSYLSFSILSSSIGFLTVIYMARTISQKEMGIIGLFMAILFLFPQLISFATTGLIAINKVKLSPKNFIDFSKSYFTFGFLNFIIIFSIFSFMAFFFKEYWQIFVLLPIISLFMFLASFHQSELIQDGFSKFYGIYNLFYAIVVALLTILFLSI